MALRNFIDYDLSESNRVNAAWLNAVDVAIQHTNEAYTPVWTASVTPPTLGNGTLTGRKVVTSDGLVFNFITLIFGTTTTAGAGEYSFSLSETAGTYAAGARLPGSVIAYDDSAGIPYVGVTSFGSAATSFSAYIHGTADKLGASSPFAFTTGDYIQAAFIYAIDD